MKTKDLEYYTRLFSKLSRGRDTYNNQRGPAPYKPLLLLSVIELIEKDIIRENKITVQFALDTLEQTFKKYQKLLGGAYKDEKSVIHEPLYNLVNDKDDDTNESFWHLTTKPETIDIKDIKDAEGRNRIKSRKKLIEHIEYGEFDEQLWKFLQKAESRNSLVDVLMDTFFSEINDRVEDTLKTVDQDAHKQSQVVREPKDTEPKFVTRQSVVRKSLFRRSVIHIYDYQCSICRLKIKTIGSRYRTIVDAAHIKPLSEVYNNRLSNGIALCKNHHWAFDNGCFGIDKVGNDYFIIVSNKFEEECLHTGQDLKTIPLKGYHQQKIFLPNHMPKEYRPDQDALIWHLNQHSIK